MSKPALRFSEFSGDWKHISLGGITNTITSGSRDWAKYYSNTGSKFIRMTNLSRGGIQLKLDDLKYVNVKTDSADGKRTNLIQGDILISITAELGKIGWIPPDFGEAFINQHTALLRLDNSQADTRCVAHILVSPKVNKIINRLNDSGAKAGLNLPTIRAINIYLPEKSEQTKIANFLTAVDEKITQLTQKSDLLAQYKKGLMQKIFSQELRFKDDDEREFPEWVEKSLGDLCTITTGKLDANAMVSNGEYRFYTCAREYYQIDKFAFDTDALLISGNGANVGYIHHYNGKFNAYQRTYVLDKFEDNIIFIKYFLEEFLHQRIYREAKEGNTPYIVMGTLTDMEIQLPVIQEQTKIASFLTAIDDKITQTQAELDAVKQYKQGLLQQMFV
jgi:type I restriction enzyme S subunit